MTTVLPATAILIALAQPVGAVVLGGRIVEQWGQGEFRILHTDTPFAVGQDTFDDDNLYAFDEDQNITLVEPIRVDIGGVDGVIAQGNVVASHYVFFDGLRGAQRGYVEFDAPILGIAAQQDTMAATDFLANTGVVYLSTWLRGLESEDRAWIDPDDPHRLWVVWVSSSPGDYIRVFTQASPGALM
ncbi:MAG: hypothetical protein HKO14_08090 [Silicimonas sp.]|nr:hypothetical protein [Silicimonas sp.]